jgi:rhodanese-related sulfurtransferase
MAADFNSEELFKKENISAQEAGLLLSYFQKEKSRNFFLVDVRTAEEFSAVHIRNSINIPLDQDSFTAMLNNTAYSREDYYLLYCRSGSRSRLFLELLKDCGFKNVAHIKDGLNRQTAGEFELETPAE